MTDLISQLAARGWVSERETPIDVTEADWAEVMALLSTRRGPTTRNWDAGIPASRRAAASAARKVTVDVLTRMGRSAGDIADQIGGSSRSIERYRARPAIGRPDPTLELLFDWRITHRPRVIVGAGDLRDTP